MARTMMVIAAAGAVGSAAFATTAGELASPMQQEQPQVCKTVVNAELGAKPYKLCMTRAEWDAKKIADAKDANRIICRYEEVPGTRFRSRKVCQPASEWDNQRLLQRQELERVQMQTPRGH
jgi:hypothetical protein